MSGEGEALNHSLFTVGSYIKCRYAGEEVEGHVAAFSGTQRLLMIRKPGSCGKSSISDYVCINADCVEKVSVEDVMSPDPVKPVDFKLLEKRRNKVTQVKKSMIKARSGNQTVEARGLFLSIVKTIDEIVWDGDKILVLNEVRISPPYKVDNVQGDKEASVTHVKKIVDKFWKEQQQAKDKLKG